MFRQRVRVSECNIRFVRRCLRRNLVENLAHFSRLIFAPPADRRPATDFSVLFLYLWCATTRYKRAKVGLEASKGNEITISLDVNN